MDIKIYNVEKYIVLKLDDIASKKNISRNQFLINYFERIAYQKELFSVFSNYEKLLKINKTTLIKNKSVMDKLSERDIDIIIPKLDEEIHFINTLTSSSNLKLNNDELTYIRIRNISSDIVFKLDQLAKENNLTKNEFRKKALARLTTPSCMYELDLKFGELLKKNIQIIDMNTKALNIFCDENLIDISSFIFENK